MKAKNARQEAILQIIGSERIDSQEALGAALREKGITTTQATLSRDLRALKIAKQPDADGYICYQCAKPVPRPRSGPVEAGILSIEFSGPVGLMKVAPGYAPVIASRIDGAALTTVAGTVAGDDTLLFVLREGFLPEQALRQLETIFPGIRSHLQPSVQ